MRRYCHNCRVPTDWGLCWECWRVALVTGLGVAAIERLVRWLT